MKPQVEIKQTCTLLVVMKGGHEFLHNSSPYAVGIIIQIYILNTSWTITNNDRLRTIQLYTLNPL